MVKWMEITLVLPEEDGQKVMDLARGLGFKQMDEDWCTEKRDDDHATMDYAPCEEPEDRRVDW